MSKYLKCPVCKDGPSDSHQFCPRCGFCHGSKVEPDWICPQCHPTDTIESLKYKLAEEQLSWEKAVSEYESLGLKYIKEKQRAEEAEAEIKRLQGDIETMITPCDSIRLQQEAHSAWQLEKERADNAESEVDELKKDLDNWEKDV